MRYDKQASKWLAQHFLHESDFSDIKSLSSMIGKLLEDQRRICAIATIGMSVDDKAYDACINATGEIKQ